MIEVVPVGLNPESFKEYGYVISESKGQPMADNQEFMYWGKVSELGMSEFASTGVLCPHKRETVAVKLERHCKTPEILAALEGDSVVCVAKPSLEGADEIEDIQAFRVKQGDVFVLFPGTWHWVPYPVGNDRCKFLVVFASGTEDNDLEVKDLQEEVKIIV